MGVVAIKVDSVSKEYRLGSIGGGTLRGDLQTIWSRICRKEDPNSKIGADSNKKIGERFLALDNVSFEIKKGEAVGIIGHNGAGKSTLLKLLSRVTAPTNGTISYNGRIASMLEVGTGFHPELTGRENIYMNGAILGMTKAETAKKFDEIVAFAEMERFIDTPVKRYSSGMYVKLAFAVAAHLDSEILIMDEVLAVGDMKFQQKCLGKMGDASRHEDKTVLYVSHNMGTIRQLCSRCIVLNRGKIIFDGDAETAIGMYAGKGDGSLDQNIVFSEPDIAEKVNKPLLRFDSAEINALGCVVNDDETDFELDIHVQASSPVKDVYFFAVLQNRSGEPLGFVTSDVLSIPKSGLNTLRAKLPINGLMGGRYKFRFVLYRSVQRQPDVLATTDAIIAFEKLENPFHLTTQYVKSVHGSFNLGKASLTIT